MTLKDVLEIASPVAAVIVFYYTNQMALKDKLADVVATLGGKIADVKAAILEEMKKEDRRLEDRYDELRQDLHAVDKRLVGIEAKLPRLPQS
jgi:hypothetical protein